MIFYGLLRNLVTRWCGDAEGTLQNDLIGGEGASSARSRPCACSGWRASPAGTAS